MELTDNSIRFGMVTTEVTTEATELTELTGKSTGLGIVTTQMTSDRFFDPTKGPELGPCIDTMQAPLKPACLNRTASIVSSYIQTIRPLPSVATIIQLLSFLDCIINRTRDKMTANIYIVRLLIFQRKFFGAH